MYDWLEQIHDLLSKGEPEIVLVTIAGVKGSAPRETGARMIVTHKQIFGTIGGGNLEFTAIDQARSILLDPDMSLVCTRQFALGPSLGQCCGGRVILSFEQLGDADACWIDEARDLYRAKSPFVVVTGFGASKTKALITADSNELPDWMSPALSRAAVEILHGEESFLFADRNTGGSDLTAYTLDEVKDDAQEIWLFGAGHVGRAIVEVMQDLPYRIKWVDSRTDEFPDPLPVSASMIISDEPQYEVATAEPGAMFLVMTHSHQLDEDICRAVLKREDFGFLGLIGSASKKARFLHRLRDRGVSEALLARMVCPIGIETIQGKKPREIAISVAAQLLSLASAGTVQQGGNPIDAASSNIRLVAEK